MTTPEFALEHAADRKALGVQAAAFAVQQWGQVDPDNISRSWLSLLAEVVAVLTGAQAAAAGSADQYVADAAELEGVTDEALAAVVAAAFAGRSADGRDLAEALYYPAIVALQGIAGGDAVDRALAAGEASLEAIVRTEVADAGRNADQVALTAQKGLAGYIRVIVGATCRNCTILAGKWYGWNEGFLRHPRCDCIHLPASQARSAGLVANPQEIYDNLTVKERTEAGWSHADQEAIAAGADLNQVTNARRAVYRAGGRELTRINRQRTSRRGRRSERLTPNQIFAQAKDDRDEAINLLQANGYLTGQPRQAATVASNPIREAQERQKRIDVARIAGDVGTDLDRIHNLGADLELLQEHVETAALVALENYRRPKREDVENVVALLRQASVEAETEADLIEAVWRIANSKGASRIGRPDEIVAFDPVLHELLTGEHSALIEISRPGVVWSDGAVITRANGFAAEEQASEPVAADAPAPAVSRITIGDLIPQDADTAKARAAEVKQALIDNLNGEYAGLRVEVYQVKVEANEIQLRATIHDAAGERVGSTKREFYRTVENGVETVWAQHAYLDLDEAQQGQGFASAWNEHLYQWYRESGVSHVGVMANIDVGGYTWARAGFDFADQLGPVRIAKRLADALAAGTFEQAQIDAAEDIMRRVREEPFGSATFPSAYEMSQAGRLPQHTGRDAMWPGKIAMLGSGWNGIKPIGP